MKLPLFRHPVWVSARKRDIEIDDATSDKIIVYVLGSGQQPKISWADLSDENKSQLLSTNTILAITKELNMNANQLKELAKTAYRAYGQVTEFKNFRGEPMPEFSDLPPKIQEAWVAAVNSVVSSTSSDVG